MQLLIWDMGKKDNLYAWAKPIGRAILVILIEPKLQSIIVSSRYKYNNTLLIYDDKKIEFYEFKGWKYQEFLDFIIISETYLHIDFVMESSELNQTFAFKSLRDPYEDLLIEYD